MANSKSSVQQFLLQSILPVFCSVLVGFIFSQDHVFDPHYSAFQFLWNAVVASMFYYLLIFARSRDAVLGFTILFFVTFLTTGSTRLAFILRDTFYIGAIGLTIFIYFKYFRHHDIQNWTYPAFVLAGLYGVIYVAASELQLGIIRNLAMEHTGGDVISLASTSAYFGVLIGFAVGMGIALNEKLADLKKGQESIAAA